MSYHTQPLFGHRPKCIERSRFKVVHMIEEISNFGHQPAELMIQELAALGPKIDAIRIEYRPASSKLLPVHHPQERQQGQRRCLPVALLTLMYALSQGWSLRTILRFDHITLSSADAAGASQTPNSSDNINPIGLVF